MIIFFSGASACAAVKISNDVTSVILILYHIFWRISTRQFGIFNVVFNRALNFEHKKAPL
jgi:hypothetical protein